MEFVAYGTLAPSQISRWNKVSDESNRYKPLNFLNFPTVRGELTENIDRTDGPGTAAFATAAIEIYCGK